MADPKPIQIVLLPGDGIGVEVSAHARRLIDVVAAATRVDLRVDASNYHDASTPKVEFDLFAVDTSGEHLEQITTYDGFDAFAMFSPDGRYLAFASNRGGKEQGETNLYIAEWK